MSKINDDGKLYNESNLVHIFQRFQGQIYAFPCDLSHEQEKEGQRKKEAEPKGLKVDGKSKQKTHLAY